MSTSFGEGKRIQVVSASLLAADIEVARSTALRIRLIDLGDQELPDGAAPTRCRPRPEPPTMSRFPWADNPVHDGRWSTGWKGKAGYYWDPAWVRLQTDIIAGQPASPLARLAYTADLASGIGRQKRLPVRGINADLAINVVRYPRGEWLCLDGRGWISQHGIGQVQATLSDTGGMSGHSFHGPPGRPRP